MREILEKAIEKALEDLGLSAEVVLEHPTDLSNGDYSSPVAFSLSKELKEKPFDIAEKIKDKLGEIKEIERIEVAGAGFLNFFLNKDEILNNLKNSASDDYGKNDLYAGKKVLIEYSQPNPFKPFHAGHIMAVTIGEALSRFAENANGNVRRLNYHGDVGRHVAAAIYGILKKKQEMPPESSSNSEIVQFLGDCYVFGTKEYENNDETKKEIISINKKIFEKSDADINKIYDWGRKASFEYFDEIYKKLGSHFDRHYFETEVAERGVQIVKENLGKVFKESDGAVVFAGEEYGLHTRVFINSEGLPTYEAKELGLFVKKLEDENPNVSITETGNEQKGYFEVVYKALSLIYPDIALKPIHVSHGMLRLPSGKMSSRLGNVITGESLIAGVENLVKEKIKDRDLSESEKKDAIEKVAISGIKYSILKQSIGKDIHFDFEKSISFEGDSGPYLQYTAVRIKSLLKKAKEKGGKPSLKNPEDINALEREVYRFPEIVKRSTEELAPQHLATYLIDLASSYNSYYASHPIIGNPNDSYRLYLSTAVLKVLERGLWLLGIKVPLKM